MIPILFTMANNDNLDYTFSLVLVTKIRDVNSTWPLCDKGEYEPYRGVNEVV